MRPGPVIRHYVAAKASRPRQWLARRGLRITPSQWRLAKLRNAHAGRRAFIIGNGPSLSPADLEPLKHEITFASNKIYLAFDQTAWRPTYYHLADLLVAEQNRDRINALRLPKIFARCVYQHFADRRDITWLDELPPLTGDEAPGFSRDCAVGVYGGYTVIYHQIQLAWHMGIRDVYLLGVDYSFQRPGASGDSASDQSAHGRLLTSNGERNHFHERYRAHGERWTEPRLDKQREAFIAARRAFEQAGGRLVNASRQTRLDVLPRIDFERAIAEPDAVSA